MAGRVGGSSCLRHYDALRTNSPLTKQAVKITLLFLLFLSFFSCYSLLFISYFIPYILTLVIGFGNKAAVRIGRFF